MQRRSFFSAIAAMFGIGTAMKAGCLEPWCKPDRFLFPINPVIRPKNAEYLFAQETQISLREDYPGPVYVGQVFYMPEGITYEVTQLQYTKGEPTRVWLKVYRR